VLEEVQGKSVSHLNKHLCCYITNTDPPLHPSTRTKKKNQFIRLPSLQKQLKNDSYYFDKKSKTIKVTAKIMPHKVVGWVDGGLDFKDCSSKECIKS